ncbi:potassium channel AKT1-like [Hibiscus syriacus]|uniref:Serine-threonine kinase receptor-associated protein n=1 Tax=Hibiscus syriacus TaxID=106335 RepID=A0A6A3CK09_HIBSY|nr:potassium channel AKT1-like [Hibiscus syriacus]
MDKKKVAIPSCIPWPFTSRRGSLLQPCHPRWFFSHQCQQGKVWDALTGDVLHSFEHRHIVRACAFSEDTHLLLTGGVEKILRIYDLNRLDAPPTEVDKSTGSVRTVTWMHSDQTILSSCTDIGGVRLWDVRSGKIVQILETKSSVTSAEVSQDGRYITTADGSTVKFWDANQYVLIFEPD